MKMGYLAHNEWKEDDDNRSGGKIGLATWRFKGIKRTAVSCPFEYQHIFCKFFFKFPYDVILKFFTEKFHEQWFALHPGMKIPLFFP
ncbi:hypothetical protein [Geobacillus sp. CAMR5420]|uniref:hypothetical protein n=1 Tax=Geobacillus sp. CAMR5420 TaxID=1482739 RepID=UPI00049F8C2E|nr:hypothetical protein [Geobacillus sp. CAMR5420]KDE50184.1 hypothetical protein DI44_01575 [Geobacillus sp. CAMR5420]